MNDKMFAMQQDVVTVHTDGGARGNPGPAACAYVIEIGGVTHESSKYLGRATNNVAEYQGVILALEFLKSIEEKIGDSEIIFYLDSELVVKQIHGTYRVKDENLKVFFFEIFTSIKNFKNKIIFKHVPRSSNKRADFLVNKELDSSH